MATRPYQGFPYSNPLVIDAPSVDEATASRWNNLPRRPVLPPQRNIYVELPEEGSQVSRPNDLQSGKKEPDPVIYIDVPNSSGSDVAGPASPEPEPAVHYYNQHNENSSDKKEPDPFIYIDLPDSSGSDVAGPALPEPETVHDNGNSSGKKDPEPVIYIDVPESSSSDVAGPAAPEPEPGYVQETIFYDQFENRRIDQQKSTDESDSGPGRRPPPKPTPPRTLNLHGAGTSGYPSTYSSSSSSREHYEDMFRPIPVSPYPDLPPAYTEIHTPHTPQRPQLQTPSPERPQDPPRTIVITNVAGDQNPSPSGEQPSPIGLASADRKVMSCHHCGLRVHTLVIWESGPITHAIAFTLFCLMLIPLIVLLYWTNACKYRNHYCPNCNKKIGYEVPALCIKMTYTTEA